MYLPCTCLLPCRDFIPDWKSEIANQPAPEKHLLPRHWYYGQIWELFGKKNWYWPPIKISFLHEKSSVYISLHYGQKKTKLLLWSLSLPWNIQMCRYFPSDNFISGWCLHKILSTGNVKSAMSFMLG